jgi:hypothetical protein
MDRQSTGYTLSFDSAHKVLMVTLGPVVSKETALASRAAIIRLVAAEGACDGIADLTAVEHTEITSEGVRWLASLIPAIPASRRRILVAPQPLIYGLSRMFQMLQEGHQSRTAVVRTLQEAFDLLGLQSPQFEKLEADRHGTAPERHPTF